MPPGQPAAPAQRKGLRWWHWLLIAGGGVIALCCILSLVGMGLGGLFASRSATSGGGSIQYSTNGTPSGQIGCNIATHQCFGAPAITIIPNAAYTATIKTAKGDIVIQLDAKHAPIAVNNFIFLARSKWYDGTYFWRVEVPGKPSPIDPNGSPSPLSLIQGGSVTSNGEDDSSVPGYTIHDDIPLPADYSPGTISMANTGTPNSANAQFFITIGDESQYFSKTYVTFGKITQGMDVVKKITAGDKIETITITGSAG